MNEQPPKKSSRLATTAAIVGGLIGGLSPGAAAVEHAPAEPIEHVEELSSTTIQLPTDAIFEGGPAAEAPQEELGPALVIPAAENSVASHTIGPLDSNDPDNLTPDFGADSYGDQVVRGDDLPDTTGLPTGVEPGPAIVGDQPVTVGPGPAGDAIVDSQTEDALVIIGSEPASPRAEEVPSYEDSVVHVGLNGQVSPIVAKGATVGAEAGT